MAKAAADQGVKREDGVITATAGATSAGAGAGSGGAAAALGDGCFEWTAIPAAGGGNAVFLQG